MSDLKIKPRIFRDMLVEAGIKGESVDDNHFVVDGNGAGIYDFFADTCRWKDRSESGSTFEGARVLIKTIQELNNVAETA